MQKKESDYLLDYPLLYNEDQISKRNKNNGEWFEYTEELKKQTGLAGPLVVVSFLQYSLQMISIMFIGHLGKHSSLSGASMATSFASATGFAFMLGMGGALETLCGQAYGAKQYHMLGIHLQRAILMLTLTCIPISFLWFYTERIFLFCGQETQISLHAGQYARWLIPSLFPYAILQCQLRFLQTQKILQPLIYTTCFTSLFHVLGCWVLAFHLEFGSKGAAISTAVAYWINVLALAAYIWFSSSCEKTWRGLSVDVFKDLLSFMALAFPSALMVCLEGWAYEFMVFISGFLPNAELETSIMSICLGTSSMVFRIPYGFGSAVSTRVSNELGAGKPRSAQVASRAVMFLAVLEGFIVGIISLGLRCLWGYVYSNDEEIVRYVAYIMPILALSNFIDGIQGVLSGIVRGCGRQNIGAMVNLGAYYLVGLPSAIILTFIFHLGGKGLWMGIICGSSIHASLLLAITFCTNWEQEAVKAKNRFSILA